MKKILYNLMIPILFVSLLVSSQVNASEKLIPLRIGQTFTFDASDLTGLGNSWEGVIAVNGVTRIPSMKQNFFIVDGVGHDEPNENPEISNLRSTTDKVYQYDGFGKELLIWQYAPIGTTWTYEKYNGDIVEVTIEAIETVIVPAGTFEGCLKIRCRCIDCGFETIHWIKPGFFMVKWIDYDNSPTIHELKSWTP